MLIFFFFTSELVQSEIPSPYTDPIRSLFFWIRPIKNLSNPLSKFGTDLIWDIYFFTFELVNPKYMIFFFYSFQFGPFQS